MLLQPVAMSVTTCNIRQTILRLFRCCHAPSVMEDRKPSGHNEISEQKHRKTKRKDEPVVLEGYDTCLSPFEKLTDAVRKHDQQAIIKMVQSGFFMNAMFSLINISDKSHINPVELACTLGYADIMELFLENGCSPNLPTSSGRLIHTVLDCAKTQSLPLKEGRRLIEVLSSRGCDFNINHSSSKTTLLCAAELGDICILRTILMHCDQSQLVQGELPNRFTPLHMSVMRGDLDCVLLLLQFSTGDHINAQDSHGNTALLSALKAMNHNLKYLNMASNPLCDGRHRIERERLLQFQYNSIAIVESILMSGADLEQYNCEGNMIKDTPLFLAMQLFCRDETKGFQIQESEKSHYSETLQLVSTEMIKDLDKAREEERNENSEMLSPYAGLVRLLVLSGGKPLKPISFWEGLFANSPHVKGVIKEMFEFWESYNMEKPSKLIHICKQKIRSQLAVLQNLHQIDSLPLPERLKTYLKLQCL